jgi:NADPH:quinone reductase-like Zn-dependent oxidoreductase
MAIMSQPSAMTALPATARALIFSPSNQKLTLQPSYPLPVPGHSKQDHLIKTQTTALCTRELTWPTTFPDFMFTENPSHEIVPGYDLAGTVVTSPPNSPFQPGDEIFTRTAASRQGNCREYTLARTSEMALKPRNLSWEDAASVPLSAITAWQMLFEKAGVTGLDDPSAQGKTVLVTAAAGGVGVWLVQLAKSAGLRVVAQIGSVENEKFVKELGAEETINYRTMGLREWVDGHGAVDLVMDLLGGKTLEECWYAVKPGGTLVSIFEPPEVRKPEGLVKAVNSLFFIMEPNGKQLGQIAKLLEGGKCRAVVDSVWSLEEYEKAFKRLDGGHANGKVVIKVAE